MRRVNRSLNIWRSDVIQCCFALSKAVVASAFEDSRQDEHIQGQRKYSVAFFSSKKGQ